MGNTRIVAMIAGAALALTGCGSGEDEASPADSSASGAVEVEAGDLYFEPESLSASAGVIEITLVNAGAVEHDFVIEEAGNTEVVLAQAGETATGSIELEAGTYTFYCSIPGHRTTMEGTLEVS
ncbi:MAG: cupredoxin domain-containing protein [Nitriliruptoraceae bacterium]